MKRLAGVNYLVTPDKIVDANHGLAVSAAVEHGAYRVSAELHLDYAVLKRRAALAGGARPAPEVAPRFRKV